MGLTESAVSHFTSNRENPALALKVTEQQTEIATDLKVCLEINVNLWVKYDLFFVKKNF